MLAGALQIKRLVARRIGRQNQIPLIALHTANSGIPRGDGLIGEVFLERSFNR